MTTDILIALSCDMSGISRLPRVLTQNGIRTSVLACPDFLLSRSRHIHSHFTCAAGAEQTARALQHLLTTDEYPYTMVILGDNPLIEYVAEHATDSLLTQYLPCGADIDLNWSKTTFALMCESSGFQLPKTCVGTTPVQADTASKTIGFPLIFKEAAGFSGETVFRFSSPAELQDYFAARVVDQPWLIQEPITGENVTVDVLFNRGEVVVWATSIVEHTCNGPFSSSTARRFVPMPELAPVTSATLPVKSKSNYGSRLKDSCGKYL